MTEFPTDQTPRVITNLSVIRVQSEYLLRSLYAGQSVNAAQISRGLAVLNAAVGQLNNTMRDTTSTCADGESAGTRMDEPLQAE